jgi:signal transduction histidine kinase
MRERIERLGGKLRIESQPGQGTRVHGDVVLGSFDEDLA